MNTSLTEIFSATREFVDLGRGNCRDVKKAQLS